MMENVKKLFQISTIYDDNIKEERSSSSSSSHFIFKDINKGNLPENFQPGENIESFSALFQLAKLNIIARMMSKEIQILLPSDQSWRLKNYFKLLNKQKEKTLELRM